MNRICSLRDSCSLIVNSTPWRVVILKASDKDS